MNDQNILEKHELLERSKETLYGNRINGYTLPTKSLYPFQWNWDSGFVSIGFSNFDIEAAFTELDALLLGQWDNGMIPHIIFHSETEESYFPNWDFWDSSVNSGAPKNKKTSGITQPPVLGFVLEWILKKHPKNPEVKEKIKSLYSAIVNSHRFWYNYRDPEGEGLVLIHHPWESGRDNSPLWDESLNRIDLHSSEIPSYARRDTNIADSSERPTDLQYDQYVSLVLLAKKHRYEDLAFVNESEFLVQDTLINAMLIRSNESLIYLGELFGMDVEEIKSWQAKSIESFKSKLWNTDMKWFTSYDYKAKKPIAFKEIGGLTSLFANIADEYQAKIQYEYLQDLTRRKFLVVPSFDVDHELFDSKRYWRGPVWPQMNWLIYHGLLNYHYYNYAETVKEDFVELVSRFGFHEYFEAQRSVANKAHGGYGGDHFSWTASTIIDFLSA